MYSLFDIPERTQFSDEGYGVLGRALAFGTQFERNLRGLASMVGIKSAPEILKDQNSINEFFMFIDKRQLLTHIKTISETLNIPEDVATILDRARIARNFLAHEAGAGLEIVLDHDDSREFFIDSIKNNVKDIAVANLVVLVLLNKMTNEPIPTPKSLNSYADKVTNWVCEVE